MKPLLIPCILGPTGAGKTAAALAIAATQPLTVINADSRQVYKDFPLITAQPSLQEQSHCPHLLYGFLASTQKISAGEYARLATQAIEQEHIKNRLPLLVGGTGLYIQTLFEGIAPIPKVPKEIAAHWQERCEKEGSHALHEQLLHIDPLYAQKIHPNDKQRITRALEVWQTTDKNLTWWHGQPTTPPKFSAIKIGIALPLSELEPLLAKRIDLMLEHGALVEAKTAFEQCQDGEAPGWSGIGCKEIYAYITQKIDLETCRTLWLKQTRAYAKRQLTWFKRDTSITWFSPWQTKEITLHVQKNILHKN